eukprot:TRINITY_DN3418_c5_g1_i1.p1 TRINITY_DN3418_c5_g1~~TRINITY_DN3418_c5_g1_i1.p1  ORF type:complete len:504 (+),score=107.56 TRINITY_DN3418_c5_g1_i1:66-1514(+)
MARPPQGWPKGPMPVTPRGANLAPHPPTSNSAPPKLPHTQLYGPDQVTGYPHVAPSAASGSQSGHERGRRRHASGHPNADQYTQVQYQQQQFGQLQVPAHQQVYQQQQHVQHTQPQYGQHMQYQPPHQQLVQPQPQYGQPYQAQQVQYYQQQPQIQQHHQPQHLQPQHQQPQYNQYQPQPQHHQHQHQHQQPQSQPPPATRMANSAPVGGLADMLGGSDDEDDDDEFFEVESPEPVRAVPTQPLAPPVVQPAVQATRQPAVVQPQVANQQTVDHEARAAKVAPVVRESPVVWEAPVAREAPRIKQTDGYSYVEVLKEGRKQPKAPEQVRSLSPRIVSLSPRQQRVNRKRVVDTATFQPNLDRARQPMREVFGKMIDRSTSATFKSSVKRGCGWSDKKRCNSAGAGANAATGGRLTTVEKMPVQSSFQVKDATRPNALFVSKVPRSAAFLEKENSYVLRRNKPTGKEAYMRQVETVNRLYSPR